MEAKIIIKKVAVFALFALAIVCLFAIPADDSANWLTEVLITKAIAFACIYAAYRINGKEARHGEDVDADNR